jgi:aminopeptidase N
VAARLAPSLLSRSAIEAQRRLEAANPSASWANGSWIRVPGYRLVADWLLKLDPLNPQTAARMSTAFDTWPRYDADRRALVAEALARMAASPGLSRDLGEMVGRMRGV